jgi:hypothetical protein
LNKTGTDYYAIKPNETLVLGYVLLEVKDKTESCISSIGFNLDGNKNYIKSAASQDATEDGSYKQHRLFGIKQYIN